MNKLIIDNQTNRDIVDLLPYVQKVLEMGRVSNDNKQYCYGTVFTKDYSEIAVYSFLNEKSDRLAITERKLGGHIP